MNSQTSEVDLSQFRSNLSLGNKLTRAVWGLAWCVLFRPSPRIAFGWRAMILRLFGAKIGRGVRIYNSVKIFLPSNLILEDNVVVGPEVDLYCVAPIRIGANAMISQYAYLCTATHDYKIPTLPLVAKPIVVESQAWVCADAFIGLGVTVEHRAIVGARAAVFKSVAAHTIVGGNPAKFIKNRDD